MTHNESRTISQALEDNCRRGGYLLACVRTLAVTYPPLQWDSLRLKLQVMGYYGGYPLEAIQRNFEKARAA
jgi:hypothetical protein